MLRPAMSVADARCLAARVERLLRSGVDVVCRVDVADLGAVEALARVRLLAQRLGACARVRVTGDERLGDLLELAGLGQVLGEPEPREQ